MVSGGRSGTCPWRNDWARISPRSRVSQGSLESPGARWELLHVNYLKPHGAKHRPCRESLFLWQFEGCTPRFQEPPRLLRAVGPPAPASASRRPCSAPRAGCGCFWWDWSCGRGQDKGGQLVAARQPRSLARLPPSAGGRAPLLPRLPGATAPNGNFFPAAGARRREGAAPRRGPGAAAASLCAVELPSIPFPSGW